jgi:hypothetical protein
MPSDVQLRQQERVSALLSAIIDGEVEPASDEVGELATDLRFQAELVQYRKLHRGLRALRTEVIDPGPALVDEVLTTVDEHADRSGILAAITPRRAAYFGGIAAATAAGVGTAFVLVRRRAA